MCDCGDNSWSSILDIWTFKRRRAATLSYCLQIITLNLPKALSKDAAGGDFHLFVLMGWNKEIHSFSSFGFMFSFCVLFPCLVLSPPRPSLHLHFFNHHDFAKTALNVSFASCAFKSSLLGQTFHLMSGITVFSRLRSRLVCSSFCDLLLLFFSPVVPNPDYSRSPIWRYPGQAVVGRDSHPNFPPDPWESSDRSAGANVQAFL